MKDRNNIFKTLAVVAVIVVAVYLVILSRVRINSQKDEIVAIAEQLEEQKEKVAKLRYELDRPIDDEYIIEIAREKLNYHLPNEIIYYNGRS